MALPTSRNTTYGTDSPINPNDLNALQDQVIGMKKPTFTRTFYPKFLKPSNFAAGTNPVNGGFPISYNSAGVVAGALFDIPYEDGDRFVNLKYFAAGNGTVDLIQGQILYAPTMGVAPTLLTSWVDNDRAAAWGLVDVGAIGTGPVLSPRLLAAGASLLVQLDTSAAGYSIGPFLAIFDRL